MQEHLQSHETDKNCGQNPQVDVCYFNSLLFELTVHIRTYYKSKSEGPLA